MRFKFLEHTADAKFQAFGKSLEEAFANAALAMTKIITKNKIKEIEKKKVSIKGVDKKSLLFRFLDEIIFLLNTQYFVLSKVKEIKIQGNNLTAILVGDNLKNYKTLADIKAITYNDMEIKEKPFMVQVVVDI